LHPTNTFYLRLHVPNTFIEISSIVTMGPSLNNHSSFVRPRTGDREGRPGTRDQTDQNLIIPSRTSSLHSRITQPIPSTLNIKPQQRTPKTLTHAYMVCGVGREPSQWVKAPAPVQGKIGHMKGAVGQFWLPEILGSSPRLEQDNEIARALHSAMRVRLYCQNELPHSTNKSLGMLSPRCRDLHWTQPTTLRAPLFRPPAGFISHPLWYCSPSMVKSR